MSWITLSIIFACLLITFIYLRRTFLYWKNRDIPYVNPIPIFGNLLNIFLLKCNIGEQLATIYRCSKEPLVGFFMLHTPALLIRDPNLIRVVLIKKFDHFRDRPMIKSVNVEKDPGAASTLLLAEYDVWKVGKRAIIPAFSSRKMRAIMPDIQVCGEKMVEYLSTRTKINPDVDMRDASLRYALEVLCTILFGLEAECFEEGDSPFKLITKKFFDYRIFERGAKTAITIISPQISRMLDICFVDRKGAEFLMGKLENELKRRKINGGRKDDYLQMLGDAAESYTGKENLLGAALEIFAASYEAISSSLGFAFHELAINKKVQEKLRSEIDSVLQNRKPEYYEDIRAMSYLDGVVKESLRKYPLLPLLERTCTEDCSIVNRLIIEGTRVYVSLLGLHYDPEYYPEPHEFRPERFIGNIDWSTYYPFGKAKKYAELVLKMALIAVVSKFSIEIAPKSTKRLKFNTKGFSLQPSGDVILRLVPLE